MATFMLDVDEEEQARVAAQRARRGRICIPGGHWPVCELRPSRAMRRRLTHTARALPAVAPQGAAPTQAPFVPPAEAEEAQAGSDDIEPADEPSKPEEEEQVRQRRLL